MRVLGNCSGASIPTMPCRAPSSIVPRPGARRGGCHWLGPGQAQAQLAAARPRHIFGCRWLEPAISCSALHRTEEGEKRMLQAYIFKCFRCFRCVLQVFQMDVEKVDQDVAYVTMVVHVCCKLLFSIFYFFLTYVASVFIWMLHIFHTYVASVLSECCTGYTHMLQMYVFKCFSYFKRMLQDVAVPIHICCKCML
jgi:hypothetical protein